MRIFGELKKGLRVILLLLAAGLLIFVLAKTGVISVPGIPGPAGSGAGGVSGSGGSAGASGDPVFDADEPSLPTVMAAPGRIPDYTDGEIEPVSIFTGETLPDGISGAKDVIVLNGNRPNFTEYDLTHLTGESYPELDSLGRCGSAYALITREMMPRGERGPIGTVRPSGFKTRKYPGIVEDGYLFHRCHLIAYALTGQNANERNLVTGTRHLNVDLMLPFETETARYLDGSKNSVLYRATPYFKGREAVCRGIELEALSVGDGGRGICFHVFLYNVQPGITIDYRTGESSESGEKPAEVFSAEDAQRFFEGINELTAVITSDLHFSARGEIHTTELTPFAARSPDITRTIADEVIGLKPDVFILCGDNTNGGDSASSEALSEILGRIADAGIRIVMVPGNHDYDQADPGVYRTRFGDLIRPEAWDPSSNSCVSSVGAFRFFMMDDGFGGDGVRGGYSEETLSWLKEEFKKTRAGVTPVFITHHNLLPGGSTGDLDYYMLRNEGMPELLENAGVTLCLTGHRHTQEIVGSGGLYEIVSGSPNSDPFYIGLLRVRRETLPEPEEGGGSGAGNGSGILTAEYRALPIDFKRYGAPYGTDTIPDEAAGTDDSFYERIVRETVKDKSLTEGNIYWCTWLLRKYFKAFGYGTVALHADEILGDEHYPMLKDQLAESNYGPWIDYVLENTELPGNRLDIVLR